MAAKKVSFQSTHSNDPLLSPEKIEKGNDYLQETLPTVALLSVEAPNVDGATAKKLVALGAWLVLNFALTLSNKDMLNKLPTPWLLSAVHSCAAFIGCSAMTSVGALKLSKLEIRSHLILVAFSTIFAFNIALSNVSLALVSVAFHQTIRSTCPVITVLIQRLIFGRTYPLEVYFAIAAVTVGVGLATAGDYYFTPLGFCLSLLGVIMACVKTIATNRILTGPLALSSAETLLRLSPIAGLHCMFLACVTGETTVLKDMYVTGQLPASLGLYLLVNATIAFALNMVGFEANRLAGALTMTIGGNIKQAATIIGGVLMFHTHVGSLNACGMAIAVAATAWYGKLEVTQRRGK